MARLGNGELRQIVNKILKELYHIAKEQHNQRKAEIALNSGPGKDNDLNQIYSLLE